MALVHEVLLFFDGIELLVALTNFPYDYTLDTKAYVPGEYNIKITALDEQGLSSSDEINISIDALLPAADALLPTLTTSEVALIKDTTAISGGEVTDDGGAQVTSKGVCWDVNPNPTINSNHTEDGPGLGEYSSDLLGLEPNTTFYVRAYAVNTAGIAYGDEVIFTTLPEEVDYYGIFEEDKGFLQIPGVGWQTFYRTAQDDPTLAGLPFKSGCAYVRWTWGDLEPVEGQYAFDMIDNWLKRCRESNQALAFRLMLIDPGNENTIPQWLIDKGIKYTYSECPSAEELIM